MLASTRTSSSTRISRALAITPRPALSWSAAGHLSPAKEPAVALQALGELLALPGIVVLPTPSDIVRTWVQLLRRRPVTGGDIFDLQLVATMLGNGVRHIYTYNRIDFEPFDELTVLEPTK